jgi:dienelactone hydrolase
MTRVLRCLILVTLVTLTRAQSSDPAARARQFIAALTQSDFAAAVAMLDVDTAAALPAAKLQQLWETLPKQVGAFRETGPVKAEASGKVTAITTECRFEKMTLDLRFTLDEAGRVGALKIAQHVDYNPPPYVKVGSFQEEEVTIGSGAWAVHGTITRPNGPGPSTAVVLVHGSGPNDRDNTIGPNKMFRDLAWGIASRGIAVLRYNKRTYEHGAEFARLTDPTLNAETVDDALAAVTLLRGARAIDSKRIFVLGHSLGATLIPRIGKADPGIAGLIVLAGTTHWLPDELVRQTEYEFTLHGPMTDDQKKTVDTLRRQAARASDPNLTASAPKSDMPLGVPASYWLDLRSYHPEQVARDLRQPMLLLQGERDYQVTMDDFAVWKKALAGRAGVEFRSYPKLNHMFFTGEGSGSDEEYLKPGHVEALVVEDIVTWLQRVN